MNKKFIIPKRVQIETIFGCNASCIMCPVDAPTSRKKGSMGFKQFCTLIDQLTPYKTEIEKFDLFGIGEPLLDKDIFKKIEYIKNAGFTASVAISTNADLLTAEKAEALLKTGIDAVIFSIDGFVKETHENIRIGINFDRMLENINYTIHLRNEKKYSTRFIVRFINQPDNAAEWDDYYAYWRERVSKDKGDLIISYDIQSWGGKIGVPEDKILPTIPDNIPCHQISDRLIILQDGTVPLCCADVHEPELDLGSVSGELSPIDIYNSPKFQSIREIHNRGDRKKIRLCRDCTILESELAQIIMD
jgi:sulfatase maturation enzyme AslB (radical SAM superfamily)